MAIEKFYTGQTVEDRAVLDVNALKAQLTKDEWEKARRTQPVYMWIAKSGDSIKENEGTPNEKETITKDGQIVFIKKTGRDLKIYIPVDANGPMTHKDLDERYTPGETYIAQYPEDDEILQKVPKGREVLKRLPNPALHVSVLAGCIKEPTILLNARGEGIHQRLNRGDSLKFEDGVVVGVPQNEFRTAWELVIPPSKSAFIA